MDIEKYNIDEILLGLVCFTLPISLKLNSIFLGVLLIRNLFLRIQKKTLFGINFFTMSLFLFGVQIISFCTSGNQEEALKKLILFLPFIIFSVMLPKTNIRIGQVFRYLLYGTLVIITYALLMSSYDVIFNNVRFDYGRGPELLLKYTPHHAYLSLFIIISILTILYQVGLNKIKSANLILILFLFLFLFLLPSRTALLISFIVLPIFSIFFLKKKYGKKQLMSFFLILFLFAIAGLSLDFARDKLIYAYYELFNIPTLEKPFYGISTRKKIWSASIDLIPTTPFFGHGIGDVQEILNKEYLKQGYKDILDYNAHNQYLQSILQYGIIFSIMFIILILRILRSLIKKKEILLLSVWVVVLFFFITESILNRQWGLVFFAVLLSLSCYKIHFEKFQNYFRSKY